VQEKKISEEIFAQIGYSDYIPQNYEYKTFIDRDEFKNLMEKSTLVIAHGGTGAIITAVKQGKKVIAVPRLVEFGEHVDNHQIQLIDEFKELNLIEPVYNIEDLKKAIDSVKDKKYNKYISNTHMIIESIEDFIEKNKKI